MVGAIVGEHTYNVDVIDSLQAYYVKALAYLGEANLRFGYKKVDHRRLRRQAAIRQLRLDVEL